MNNLSKMAVRAAVSLALFGSVSMANAADTIKIGIAGPLTGPVAQYGDMQFTGGKMAVEQINKAGGIKGSRSKPSSMTTPAIPSRPWPSPTR